MLVHSGYRCFPIEYTNVMSQKMSQEVLSETHQHQALYISPIYRLPMLNGHEINFLSMVVIRQTTERDGFRLGGSLANGWARRIAVAGAEQFKAPVPKAGETSYTCDHLSFRVLR